MKTAVRNNKVKKSKEDKIFDFILYGIAAILIVVALYPMYFIVIASISNPNLVSNGEILFLPKGINFKAYEQLASYSQLWTGYKNTILYVIFGTIFTLVVNIPAAYALSRRKLYGRKALTIFYLIPMFFTGGLIPTYLAVQQFHLLDTFWVMVLPFSVVTYYIIVGRTFLQIAFQKNCGKRLSWMDVGIWASFSESYCLYPRRLLQSLLFGQLLDSGTLILMH